MGKKPESAFDFELPKFDMSKMMDFSKMFGDMRLPGVDVETLVNSQRKNIDALTAANRLAVEGVQAVIKRQMEIVRQTAEELQSATKAVTSANAPQEKATKQTELAKEAFERTLANMRELAEMMAKANNDAFELLNKRFSQQMDELRDAIAKLGK